MDKRELLKSYFTRFWKERARTLGVLQDLEYQLTELESELVTSFDRKALHSKAKDGEAGMSTTPMDDQ